MHALLYILIFPLHPHGHSSRIFLNKELKLFHLRNGQL